MVDLQSSNSANMKWKECLRAVSYTHLDVYKRQLRQFGGMSGFPKVCESPHDVFDTGHSSTAISLAMGMAVSRDLKHDDYSIVAIIGDGAMTGGLAFEGLNNMSESGRRVIVILNDNGMSISPNVGAVSYTHLQSGNGIY